MAADTVPRPQLTCDDLLQLLPSLLAYLDRFRSLFLRRDQPASFAVYAERLLSRGAAQVGRVHGPAPTGQRHEPSAPPAVICDGQCLVRPTVSGTPLTVGGGRVGHARGHPAGGHDRHAQAGRGPAGLRSAGAGLPPSSPILQTSTNTTVILGGDIPDLRCRTGSCTCPRPGPMTARGSRQWDWPPTRPSRPNRNWRNGCWPGFWRPGCPWPG